MGGWGDVRPEGSRLGGKECKESENGGELHRAPPLQEVGPRGSVKLC